MVFLYEYGVFLAKTVTIVLAIVAILLVIFGLRHKKAESKGQIEVDDLNVQFDAMKTALQDHLTDQEEDTKDQKETPEACAPKQPWWKFWKKKTAISKPKRPVVYILDFDGGIHAEEVNALRHEVTAILQNATPEDEVFIRLTSPGGVVNGYGLAASQLVRIRQAGLHLTVAVDEVAASGGYLMAVVAHKILASPFALIGSIGVVAQMPNFHRLLEKYDIDYEQFTAGEYKRTVTLFGKNTEDAKVKFREELAAVHALFKEFVIEYRPQLEIEKIATGEHWLARQAQHLGLVDALMTSDSYLLEKHLSHHLLQVKFVEKKNISQKFSRFLGRMASAVLPTSHRAKF